MRGRAAAASYAGALHARATAAAFEDPAMSENKRVEARDIDSVMTDGKMFFLDVREPTEIEELGSYEGSLNIPVTQLEERLGELPKDKTILTA